MKFKFPLKLKLNNLLYNKKFTVVLSIVLAFALWLGISMTENTVRKQSFDKLTATVSLEGTAAEKLGLGIFSDFSTQHFTVTVEGPNHVVSSLKAEDFVLTASTYEVNAAKTYNLAISAENVSGKTGYNIVSIEPSTIEVTVDYIVTKDFPVNPKLIGVNPGEGLVWEQDDLMISDEKQETISIKGPRSKMEKIKTVYAVAEANETLFETKTYDANIVLCDENDKELYRFNADGTVLDSYNNPVKNSFLTLSFKSTKFVVKVSKQKTVECVPVFENLPDGITAEDIKYAISINTSNDENSQEDVVKSLLENNIVTIKGEPSSVDKIEKLFLTPIDFKQASLNDKSFEVSLADIPDNVTVVENPMFFTVDIDLSGYTEKTFTVNNFKFTGTGDLESKLEKDNVSVRICAPKDIIGKIKSKELYLEFDMSDKIAGKYEVVPVLKSEVHSKIWQIDGKPLFVTLY